MAPKTPEHTTQTTKVELPKWVDKASLENYKFAKRLGNKDFKPYRRDMVADLDPSMQEAFDYLQQTGGESASSYNNAENIFQQVANTSITPREVQMGQLKDTNLDPYINPYVNNVEKHSLAALDDSRRQSLMGNSDKAASAGAFGSSRHGIVDAVTNAETAKDAGLLSAQLRSDAFTNAQGAAFNDISNKFTGDSRNADADMNAQMAKIEAMLQGGQGIMGAADARQQAGMQQFAGMLQEGQTKTGQRQSELDAKRSEWDRKQGTKIDNLNLRLSALGMSPYGKTENVERTTQPASAGTDWAQAGLGVFSLLLGLSDDDTKTDKEKVGKLPGTDLDIWAYRYKKDPKTYPKVVGIMASDVEKKMPKAVSKIGDKRVVDYTEILKAM